jgi:tight adherence protein B
MTFLSIELEVAPATSGVLVSAHALVPQWLIRKFRQAGWMLNGRALVFVLLGYMAAVTLTIWRFGFLGGALAALAVGLIAITVLEWQAQAGMRHLSDSMLGFLERVRQLITVGNSLPAALERAVANSPPVVVNALTPTVRRIRNGSGVAESLERCALDLEVYELNLLATAARTNMRFGGSMTQILRNMIENIRKRTAVERELRADTTQVRASAWVLALLPVLVAAVVMLTNRSYSRWFLATESGHHMIAYAIVSQFIGVVLMRMITRVRY